MNIWFGTLLAGALALASAAAQADVTIGSAAIKAARDKAVAERNVLAVSVPTNIKVGPTSTWSPKGNFEVWSETVQAPGAGRIGFYAPKAVLPLGSELVIIGKTGSDRVPQRLIRKGFTVPLQDGEKLTLELRVPTGTRKAVDFQISSIDVAPTPASGSTAKSASKAYAKAAAPAGCKDAVNFECKHDSTNDLASRSTVNLNIRFKDYVGVCTGVLVNPINSSTNYLLTATHCRGGETIVDFVMHWGASATCGDPYWDVIAASDYAKATTSGATLVMEHNDMAMYRIGDVPAAAKAWRAGFDASGTAKGARFFGIHHASNLPKHWLKASNNSTYLANQPADQWIVTSDYTSGEDGIVRTGSSGSGLFDNDQNVLGTLFGGDVENCQVYGDGRQELAYNALSVSWLGGGTASTSLKPWLDPTNTGRRTNTGAAVGAADGACGASNGGSFSTYPSTGLCAVGTASSTDSTGTDGSYNWNCSGVEGGAPASCSATRVVVITGTCGTSANQSTPTFPSSNHCATGTLTTLDTTGNDGQFNWSCNGSNGGGNANCVAPKSSPGSCGSATSTSTSSYPTSNLCAAGSASATDSSGSDGSFNWTCSGTNGGPAASCSVPKTPAPTPGQCGGATSSPTTSYPASGHCAAGSPTSVDSSGSDGSFNWTCSGTNGGAAASCSVPKAPAPTPGQCGGANSTPTSSYPVSGHCAVGSPTSVDSSGSDGSFNWTCSGANGGAAASCSAPKTVTPPPVPGQCGNATASPSQNYPSANLCASGSPTAIDSTGSDGSFNWSCSGSNGGAPASCSTPREVPPAPVNGNCGSAISSTHTQYPSSGLCASGSAIATDSTGSDGSYDWNCQGSNGGSTMQCSASQQVVQPPPSGGGGGGGAFGPIVSVVTLLLGLLKRLGAGSPPP